MRSTRDILRAGLMVLVSALLCGSAFAQGASTADKPRQNLTATSDGKFLVDSSGKKVLQYLDSAKAFVPMTVETRPDGKLRLANEVVKAGITFYPCNCRNECIRWDANGNCNGTYRTCDICTKGSND